MKRIGEIAARLVANPIELVAAANQKRSTRIEGGDEPVAQGVRPSPSPIAAAGGGDTARELRMKKAGTPVSETSRPVEGRSQQYGKPAHALDMHANGNHMVAVLRLSRCERIAIPRPGAMYCFASSGSDHTGDVISLLLVGQGAPPALHARSDGLAVDVAFGALKVGSEAARNRRANLWVSDALGASPRHGQAKPPGATDDDIASAAHFQSDISEALTLFVSPANASVSLAGVLHIPAPKSIPARNTRAMNMASVMMF